MREYHDREWGTPLHDDRRIFEFLVLEGMQAGLSWSLVLNKRENFRKAFKSFDPAKVAKFTDRDVQRLLNDAGIIRNRLKILGAINNAKRFLEVQKEFGTFDKYIWGFVGGKPLRSGLKSFEACPRKRRCPIPSARTSRGGASSSSARPSSTRTCRRPAWSTITW